MKKKHETRKLKNIKHSKTLEENNKKKVKSKKY